MRPAFLARLSNAGFDPVAKNIAFELSKNCERSGRCPPARCN